MKDYVQFMDVNLSWGDDTKLLGKLIIDNEILQQECVQNAVHCLQDLAMFEAKVISKFYHILEEADQKPLSCLTIIQKLHAIFAPAPTTYLQPNKTVIEIITILMTK